MNEWNTTYYKYKNFINRNVTITTLKNRVIHGVMLDPKDITSANSFMLSPYKIYIKTKNSDFYIVKVQNIKDIKQNIY